MSSSHEAKLTPQPTPCKATPRARSRTPSTSSVLTSASLHSTPIKVPVVSSTSQPTVSQDYANADLEPSVGKAIPELRRTVSDLSLNSDASSISFSRSSLQQHRSANLDGESPVTDFLRRNIPQREPLGSRRSTISASATTTSLNFETADPVTACSARTGAANLLSQTQHLERGRIVRQADNAATKSNLTGTSLAFSRKELKEEPAVASQQRARASVSEGNTTVMLHSNNGKVSMKPEHGEESSLPSNYPERRYFMLTSAGKPVFCSHTEDEESLTRMMGVAQAIISIYDEADNKLQSIAHGRTKITFLLADPLYLFCVSEWNEPDFVNLLYVVLVVGNKIVTLLRPRKHSIHPTDLHLLLNVLAASPALRTSQTWLPICLPKFNPDGFVYAFISYIRYDVGLLFVSADKEGFEPLREWRDGVVKKLEDAKVLNKLESIHLHHEYSIGKFAENLLGRDLAKMLSIKADLELPGVRHFWYKSRRNVQITMPRWEPPYIPNSDEQKRLITLYQHIYDGIHAKSGQLAPMKQFYIQTEFEACMGWSTNSFELYLTASPELPKHAVVSAANAIVRWINKEESRLFLRDAPVF
ncbi:hypothetical protein QFC19_002711 [Naganishia cerealis]|uniref:Uncharacterized protein n=1 Tax=Naganishia cerealis TaxID=610337 RepID=A0ACC2W9R9_9TREE|nr:hypothetical protein QFC19_002711 [Naganishia cerealis]